MRNCGRQRDVVPRLEETVLNWINDYPNDSTPGIALRFNVSQSQVIRLLKEHMIHHIIFKKYKTY